jgi:tetratricopeptide (TPR) repeat protein
MKEPRRPVHAVAPAQWARSLFIALLPVFACFLGGSTSKWAEGIIVALLGAYLIFQPPRHSLGWATNTIFVLFAFCALASFLPATWFFTSDWRKALTDDFGIALPSTLTVQPWLTAECFASLVAALSWLYLVSTQDLELRVMRFQLRLFATGIVAIAALSIFLYLTHHPLPVWRNERGFGPFPNRNQTADLFGITSVLILAAGQDDIRYGRKRWMLWAAGLVIIIAALILNFSRAGIIILVAGSAIWVAAIALRTRSAVPIALAASFVLLLLSALLVTGGATLERFHLQRFAGTDFPADFRWLIFRDTWNLICSTPPWCGLGLGNFESVFAIFRDASRGNTRAFHPESDWLWLWTELGIVAPVLIIVGAALLLRRVPPLPVGSNQRFRIAALIGAMMFALHGMVDVSGHRVGTAYSSLFLLGLAIYRPLQLPPSRIVPWIFRFLGLALLGIGAAWTISWRTMALLPGPPGVANAKELAAVASRGRNFSEAINLADRALVWAPLDWELYYVRASAKISARAPIQSALDDFRRARFLEPNSVSVPLEEGIIWSAVKPSLAYSAWREALRRADGDRRSVFGRIFFHGAVANPNGRDLVERLAFTYQELVIAYLEQLPAPDFQKALSRLLQVDSDLAALSDLEKQELFRLWQQRGDSALLARSIERHPEWESLAWRFLAQARADAGNFREACELMQKNFARVTLPPPLTGRSLPELRNETYRGANNYAAGYTLYREQINSGQLDDALATVRHFTETKAPPAYFHFLEAAAWADKQNWERSWKSWLAFEQAKTLGR